MLKITRNPISYFPELNKSWEYPSKSSLKKSQSALHKPKVFISKPKPLSKKQQNKQKKYMINQLMIEREIPQYALSTKQIR